MHSVSPLRAVWRGVDSRISQVETAQKYFSSFGVAVVFESHISYQFISSFFDEKMKGDSPPSYSEAVGEGGKACHCFVYY